MENEYDLIRELIEILRFIAKKYRKRFQEKELSFKGGDKRNIQEEHSNNKFSYNGTWFERQKLI